MTPTTSRSLPSSQHAHGRPLGRERGGAPLPDPSSPFAARGKGAALQAAVLVGIVGAFFATTPAFLGASVASYFLASDVQGWNAPPTRSTTPLANLLNLDHEQAFAAMGRFLRTRESVTLVTMYLDIGSMVVALIAAILAIDFTRHFAAAMRRNVELEAERARELDLVAQRAAHGLVRTLAGIG